MGKFVEIKLTKSYPYKIGYEVIVDAATGKERREYQIRFLNDEVLDRASDETEIQSKLTQLLAVQESRLAPASPMKPGGGGPKPY